MNSPQFDLEEIADGIRQFSSDAEQRAIKAGHPIDLIKTQTRQVEIHVAFSRWLLGEFNKGTSQNRVAQAAGSLAAKLLETAAFEQSPEFIERLLTAFENTMDQRGATTRARPVFHSKPQGKTT